MTGTQVSALQIELTGANSGGGDRSGGWFSHKRLNKCGNRVGRALLPSRRKVENGQSVLGIASLQGMAKSDKAERSSNIERMGNVKQKSSENSMNERRKHLEQLFTQEDIRFLKGAPDPVQCMANRIVHSVVSRQAAGGLTPSKPYVAHILNYLEAGVCSFEFAKQLKEVPMPFAYVQLNAVLLLVFNTIERDLSSNPCLWPVRERLHHTDEIQGSPPG